MQADTTGLRLAVLAILDRWEYYDWSVQGFGVLRNYIKHPWQKQSCGRLHIWDAALRYPGVSMVHNHSWDLKSTVVCGKLVNQRFFIDPVVGYRWNRQRLLTGYDSQMVQPEPDVVFLMNQPREIYGPGDVYHQHAAEIHETLADDGTVTLMARQEDDGPGYADVLWPVGEEWGTAKPRQATPEEIHGTISKALRILEDSNG